MTDVLSLDVHEKRFGDTLILDHVHVGIKPREVVALLGPSGCGKSTLLRIASGLDRDYVGQVRLLDHSRQQQGARRVAFIFQEPRLMPWLTVEENVSFSDGKRADTGRAHALLSEVGLAGWERALPKQLSGGMAQRVAIARGLYSQPDVLLLDEPFSAVDAFTRMRLQDLLLSIADSHSIAILLVTHDIDESLYLADRVLVMGSHPGTILHTINVPLPRPRERTDGRLSTLKVEALESLHGAHAF
ncbi:ABC transporter ATP-binding protein [Halomonas sp. SpR8]|uniref:ABC transporter ATP-binding protein n=1 Tax=Halomonas sp. SpR8 TaxID=3050463 RepID=UPI0027E462BA|nr:ABC transporter ATP-binding protein [Halomonas sp. SpR8]MDQ7727015.1 ABC transporter ATP-binding protein [Halomonas sp. SpR8]